MNPKQLAKSGVPVGCIPAAVNCIRNASKDNQKFDYKDLIPNILSSPEAYEKDKYFAEFSKSLLADRDLVIPEPIDYAVWGIAEGGVKAQLERVCRIPNVTKISVMPDSHVGYGVPIGTVFAVKDLIVPQAIGVDIGCSVCLSIIDMEPETLAKRFNLYKEAIEKSTRFGMGAVHEKQQNHAVMDDL